ncbi:adenylosuccinate lyase [Formosa haliotis]|uniref:adenylosuccinate lyase n=1 Tax=Formosa haliotis TaxID=1555194 RepID=UPI0008243EEC|nr:adenylosuccinate lyase [Formosa haliotis]
MTTEQLYEQLNYVNHSRENRLKFASLVFEHPDLMPTLLDILFKIDDKISCKAAWVLEFACAEHLAIIYPYLDTFTAKMHTVHLDSAVRPVAKICEYLAKANTDKMNFYLRNALTPEIKERIISVCFDYLIKDEKVATKAYAMQTLYLFGKEYDWIYPELADILSRDYHVQSAAFKARARHILKKIKIP